MEIPKYAWCSVSAVSTEHNYVQHAHPCVGLLADVDLVRGGGAGELLGVPNIELAWRTRETCGNDLLLSLSRR